MPSILILQHYKENLRKCSLSHLRGDPGIEFRKLKVDRPAPQFRDLRGLVLVVGAPVLCREDVGLIGVGRPLILLDSTWAKVDALLRNVETAAGDDSGELDRLVARGGDADLCFRALPDGLETAYPRKSKLFSDPGSGLASIEALVVALEILGMPAVGFLDSYRWKDEFLARNQQVFSD